METTTYYKVLGPNRDAWHGGSGTWPVNRWTRRIDPIPCQQGWHLCRRQDLLRWLGPTIWIAEADGKIVERDDKVCVERARITRRLDSWNDTTARLFAADCAEHVLHLFERERPSDDRPRKAIEAARAFARGEIDAAAWAAAWAAARDAARDAAGGAAWAADAARDAAWDAAWAAARAAARAAAWDAAWAAARAAARAAAGGAVWAWQTDRLFQYLDGGAS